MPRRLCALCVLVLPAVAMAAAPPPPPLAVNVWDARVRYRIAAFASDRVRQYRELMRLLDEAGFERSAEDPAGENEAEDPNATRLLGTLPDRSIKRVLGQRHVRSLTLSPKGSKLPEKAERVRVEATLEGGFSREAQQSLARQTAAELAKRFAFVESVGYDHAGFVRLVGSVPAEHLERLSDLVRVEMRLPDADRFDTQAAYSGRVLAKLTKAANFSEAAGSDNREHTRLTGYVLADDASALQNYFIDLAEISDKVSLRTRTIIRLVIARPDLPVPSGRPAAPKVPAEQLKFDPALRSLLGDADTSAKGGRLEVILGYTPTCRDKEWIRVIESSGGVVEGRSGPLVTVAGVPKDIAPKLAALTEVVAVRLPRAARQAMEGPRGEVPAKWEPVKASGLTKLHALGLRGKGTRVAVIADDFKGWEELKGRKDGKAVLPELALIDLTGARNFSLQADAYPSADKDTARGHGTRSAAAILAAAPDAELTLIRVDAAASYMLEEVARAINGETQQSITLAERYRELQAVRRTLELRADELLAERNSVFANLGEDDASKKRLADYKTKQAAYDADFAEVRRREGRYLRLVEGLKELRGVRMVASGLVWPDGYPVDGTSALSRYFDDKPFRSALWFQSAGDTRGQAWSGLFRDADATGVMEFADEKAARPAGAWTNEINFLSWQPNDAEAVRELPAGASVRVTLQWREPHDCLPLRAGEDVYREPLAKLKLVLVRQLDPSGRSRPVDDLEVISETTSLPQRLNQTLNMATWEHVLELRVATAGRYGVFIEGKPPESTQAEGEARLPLTKKFGELRTRLFVNSLEGAGRAVWVSFPTEVASLGMPADARQVITVGAADAQGKARPSSASGPPYDVLLLRKPDVLAYDDGGGTTEATSFALGLTASAWGSKGTLLGAIERLRPRPGELLRVR